jgi:hypothetical protein
MSVDELVDSAYYLALEDSIDKIKIPKFIAKPLAILSMIATLAGCPMPLQYNPRGTNSDGLVETTVRAEKISPQELPDPYRTTLEEKTTGQIAYNSPFSNVREVYWDWEDVRPPHHYEIKYRSIDSQTWRNYGETNQTHFPISSLPPGIYVIGVTSLDQYGEESNIHSSDDDTADPGPWFIIHNTALPSDTDRDGALSEIEILDYVDAYNMGLISEEEFSLTADYVINGVDM